MAFLLAHLSDPHLPPLPPIRPHDLFGKRALGYLNWTRHRQFIHQRSVLDDLIADLHAQRPDHIAITGDLVNLALAAEFEPARQWLESVGPPDNVTVVPGNHDAYVRSTQHLFAKTFQDYLRGEPDGAQHPGAFPMLRRRGPITLIAVSSAVPTPPLMATGWLGRTQRDALDAMLAALSGDSVCRVLLIHHPLRSQSRFKRLTDADDVLTIVKRHGVDLILHGHDHVHSTRWIDGPRGLIPLIGVPSASAIAHGHTPGAAYNLFFIDRDSDGWRIDMSSRGLKERTEMAGQEHQPRQGIQELAQRRRLVFKSPHG